MDWKSVIDAINQAEQSDGGGGSLPEGWEPQAGEGVFHSAIDAEHRERIFARAAQLARDTADFGANLFHDPGVKTSADYHTVMPKIIQGRQDFATAIAAAEQLGRLGEFYGKIGQRGAFDAAGTLVPISKLGLAGKPGAPLKAAGELADSVKGEKAQSTAEAAAAVGAQFSRREFSVIAKCPKAEPAVGPGTRVRQLNA